MNKKIAIVVSEFNQEITSKLLAGCLERLNEVGYQENNRVVIKVPGAIEIPLVTQLLAKQKQYEAIICLGAVIRGDTDHYDYVCQQVSQGCQKVMLEFETPVIFGVLTTNNTMQAEERVGGKEGHKGKEAAEAAIAMLKVTDHINSLKI